MWLPHSCTDRNSMHTGMAKLGLGGYSRWALSRMHSRHVCEIVSVRQDGKRSMFVLLPLWPSPTGPRCRC